MALLAHCGNCKRFHPYKVDSPERLVAICPGCKKEQSISIKGASNFLEAMERAQELKALLEVPPAGGQYKVH
mgnify:CR=1 FL=1